MNVEEVADSVYFYRTHVKKRKQKHCWVPVHLLLAVRSTKGQFAIFFAELLGCDEEF